MTHAHSLTDNPEVAPRRRAAYRSDHAKPRVLFMGEAVALSHVARPALLAAHLAKRGWSVCFARDPRYDRLLPPHDFPQVELDSLPSSIVLRRLYLNEPIFDVDTLERYIQADLRIMRAFQPDIVVGDSRFSLIVSSQLTGIPFVNIVDAHWSPCVDTKFEPADSPVSRLIGVPLSNLFFQFTHPLAFAFHTIPINTVLRKYRLPEIAPDIRSYFSYGDYTLYPNDSGLYRLREPLPPEHAFIGPLLWSPEVPKPAWWDRLPRNRPVIYVSLGSTGEPRLLPTVFRVLRDLPVSVIAATAARDNPPKVPGNVYLAEFVPGMEAARRSQFVICNGGAMSGQQALSSGVPFLGLISNIDQMLYSRAVQRAGACELIRESEVSEDSLRPLVQALLTEHKYRAAAAKTARRTALSDPFTAFEQFISSAAQRRARSRPSAAGFDLGDREYRSRG
jgi:UDP:flavonoid glycosyltransferase YjiC (YdhE family)